MNWIVTNIRFPQEHYAKLKVKAAKQRKSVAQLVRETVANVIQEDASYTKTDVKKFLQDVKEITKENAKYTKGFDSVKALREIRYTELQYFF